MVLYVVFFYSYTIDNRFHWLFRTSSLNGDYCTVLAVFRPADSHVPLVTCSRSAMLLCSKAFVWCWEQCFFFSLADSRLSVNQHSSELARADGWLTWSDPGNECSALPSLSPVSTFHIQYYTNAEHSPFPPHFPPAVSCNYPLTAFFFSFSPQHKMWPAAPHSRTEKVWVGLLPQLS